MKRPNARLALLALAVFLLSLNSVWAVANFTPIETPAAVSASATSASTSFTLASAINASDVKPCNLGTSEIYWVCGSSSIQATLPGAGSTSTPLGAGLCGVYHKGAGTTTCAAITATSTSTVTFTAGEGF